MDEAVTIPENWAELDDEQRAAFLAGLTDEQLAELQTAIAAEAETLLDNDDPSDDETPAPIPDASTIDRASWGRTADARRGQAQTVQVLPGTVDEAAP